MNNVYKYPYSRPLSNEEWEKKRRNARKKVEEEIKKLVGNLRENTTIVAFIAPSLQDLTVTLGTTPPTTQSIRPGKTGLAKEFICYLTIKKESLVAALSIDPLERLFAFCGFQKPRTSAYQEIAERRKDPNKIDLRSIRERGHLKFGGVKGTDFDIYRIISDVDFQTGVQGLRIPTIRENIIKLIERIARAGYQYIIADVTFHEDTKSLIEDWNNSQIAPVWVFVIPDPAGYKLRGSSLDKTVQDELRVRIGEKLNEAREILRNMIILGNFVKDESLFKKYFPEANICIPYIRSLDRASPGICIRECLEDPGYMKMLFEEISRR